MAEIPRRFIRFQADYPEIAEAYEKLGDAIHGNGPLSKKERALIKFAISVGARLEGGAHSHIRKALSAGVKPEELRHVALLAIQTIGFPSAMAAMSWIEDIAKPAKKKKAR